MIQIQMLLISIFFIDVRDKTGQPEIMWGQSEAPFRSWFRQDSNLLLFLEETIIVSSAKWLEIVT